MGGVHCWILRRTPKRPSSPPSTSDPSRAKYRQDMGDRGLNVRRYDRVRRITGRRGQGVGDGARHPRE
jgi:hypothetical protein